MKETGPKLCACGTIGFPYEHKSPRNLDAEFLLALVEEYERALRIAVEMCPDENSSSEMWSAQEAASDALTEAERLAGEEA